MFICPSCGSPSKQEGWLCLDCYNKNRKGAADDKEGGLSNREYNYRYNMIKGRIAETLIQELFLSLKYNVFRYGMENTIPGIMDLLRGVRNDVSDQIKQMPDFVVQNPRTGDVYFIEVKFRANGSFNLHNLEEKRDYPYENAFIIIVSKRHIKCLSVADLRAGKEITPTSINYLGSRKEFELDKDVIREFCDFAVKFFENVEDPKPRN